MTTTMTEMATTMMIMIMIDGHNNQSDTNTLGYDRGIPHPENVSAAFTATLKAQLVGFDMGCGLLSHQFPLESWNG